MQTSTSAHRVETRADLARAIVAADQAGAIGAATLMRALHDGRIAFLPVLPETTAATFKACTGAARQRPTVVLLGDDDYQERGPPGWSVSRRATRWAAAILLHAAGGKREHYEGAIEAAQVVGRVLVIECSTTTLPLWRAAIAAAPHRPGVLVIAPTEGPHPVMPATEQVQ